MKNEELFWANGALLAACSSLTFFWILNILKESFAGVKSFLNFYPPVGPLLGLFVFSILVHIIIFIMFSNIFKITNQKWSFWVLIISSVLFFFMVFPPVFAVIAGLLH